MPGRWGITHVGSYAFALCAACAMCVYPSEVGGKAAPELTGPRQLANWRVWEFGGECECAQSISTRATSAHEPLVARLMRILFRRAFHCQTHSQPRAPDVQAAVLMALCFSQLGAVAPSHPPLESCSTLCFSQPTRPLILVASFAACSALPVGLLVLLPDPAPDPTPFMSRRRRSHRRRQCQRRWWCRRLS